MHHGGGAGFHTPEFLLPLLDAWLDKSGEDREFFEDEIFTESGEIGTARRQKMCEYLSKKSLNELAKTEVDTDLICKLNLIQDPLEEARAAKGELGISRIMEHLEHPGKKVLSRCIDCHKKDNGFAPHIPFENYDEFGEALTSQKGQSYILKEIERRTSSDAPLEYSMPLNGPRLTDQERKDLLNFINLIKEQ